LKALHLNLASRPYHDRRPMTVTLLVLGALTALLTFNNVQTAYEYFANTETTRERIAVLESELNREQQALAASERQLAAVDVRRLNTQIAFINDQIAERAFSWSRMLDHLEAVLPRDVRVTRLSPSADKDGNFTLRLVCAARNERGLINLLDRLTADPHFTRAYPQIEAELEGGLQQFTLQVDYHPGGSVTQAETRIVEIRR
jgi:Tfp pilus assembly protein PilN